MPAQVPADKEWNISPATEFAECDGEYRITAELPDLTADNIAIGLRDSTIKIRGEKSEEKNKALERSHSGSVQGPQRKIVTGSPDDPRHS